MIYAIVSGDFVKIGISENPRERLRAIQTGSALPCSLIGTTPGDIETERIAHRLLRSACVGGEWFKRTGLVNEFIQSLDPVIEQTNRRTRAPHSASDRSASRVAAVKKSRAKHPAKYRAYQRDYMRKRRAKAKT